jgi:uncharacterized membrane protein YbhN (UPF0104 family)/membrane-associated phospholipid phosphatase
MTPTVEGPSRTAKSRRRQILRFALSAALFAAVIWYVKSNVADFSDVWAEIRAMTPIELGVLLVFAVWNLVTYWIVTVLATPGLTYPQALVQTETTTAVANTVPAGGAVGVGLTYAMFGSWGFSKSRTSLSVVVSGIWNNFAKLGLPIVALSALAIEGQAGGGKIVAALLGVAALIGAIIVFALILNSQQFAGRVGIVTGRWASALRSLVHRGPVEGWDLAFVKFRARVIGLVRARWLPLTVWTLVGHLSLYAVLLVTLRQVGVSDDEVGWAEVLAVFAFARLLTAIPLTPGGVGMVELALISGLSAAGGAHAQVVAAVLAFRVLTYVLPIPFGLCTYIYWRRNTSWLDSAPPLDPRFTAVSVDDYVPVTSDGSGRRKTLAARAADRRMAPWSRAQHFVYALIGLGVLIVSGLIVRNGEVGSTERKLFSWINGLPEWLYRPMWLFQQAGNLILAFVIVILVAIVLRRPKLAVAAVGLVGLKLLLERVVKAVVERQRPGTSIGDVILRGSNVSANGLSFVSGHAVLAAAVATVLMPVLPRRWRLVPWVFVVLNGVARVYVGAHNPLDIVGGVGLGMFIGGLLNAGLAPPPQGEESSVDQASASPQPMESITASTEGRPRHAEASPTLRLGSLANHRPPLALSAFSADGRSRTDRH